MIEKEVRDTFSDYGVWLDPDLEGEYNNGKAISVTYVSITMNKLESWG